MADRNPTLAVAIAFLVLVLVPQMVVSGKGKYPRLNMTPRTKKQLRDFFKDHASDMSDLFPGQGSDKSSGGNSSSSSKPGDGGGDGGSQAPATNAGKYIFSFDVGTPPQRVSGALDINSQLVWTDCGTTTTTTSTSPGGGTLFYPTQSNTTVVACTSTACQQFVPQTCDADEDACTYTYTYNGGSASTTGYLAVDSFSFDDGASDPVDLVFGCGVVDAGDFGDVVSGVVGLGRGPYSLVSQLEAERFSYYFAPDDSTNDSTQEESFIHFGDDAAPKTSRALSAPLLASSAFPDFYYVGLTGIRVDGQDLAIPRGTFDLQTDGSGGVFLSIGIPVTFLDEVAYKLVRKALVSKIGLPTADGSALGLDLCYTSQALQAKAIKIPAMALVFDGGKKGAAVMELETWNYFYMDATTGLECLAMLPATAGGGSLLGSVIQAGTHMIYDISGSKLLFESLVQASPSPSDSSKDASQPSNTNGKGSPMRSSSSAPPLPILPVVVANFVWIAVHMLSWAAF